ncbi:MAG: isoleucine--tRNA ligase [Phycisphaerae bacterium]
MTTEPAPNVSSKSAVDYRSTLNLPKTVFDMKANLTRREPEILARWKSENLYQCIRSRAHRLPKWVLHDGPPYANGDIHMGHLINKVLKDMVVKYRTMQGHDAPYVPGWDCHGLPIESAIQKELGPKMRELSALEIRRRCRDYALKYVQVQSASFERLGILGQFDKPYLTLDPVYEAGVLEVLANLLQRDLVFRQRKPVHWCTFDQTALAEAELEYSNRKDISIFVKFSLDLTTGSWPAAWGTKPTHAHLLIWTTTPWTIPANRAVAVHPDHQYAAVTMDAPGPQVLILAVKRIPAVMLQAGITHYQISAAIPGTELIAAGIGYTHPLDAARTQPVIPADYVTLEDGTGLVHTAPGHGAEDYQTGRKAGLDVYCPVLPDGRYDQSVPDFLRGQSIWASNELVVQRLADTGLLFQRQEIEHSYPHCWRCRKATILRATEQWFVRAGGNSPLLQTAQNFIGAVQWIPAWGKNRMAGMLETRPDWCISRQRSWGVPIPAFFAADGEILLTEKSVRRVAEYVRQHGADCWFTHSPAQILGTDQWVDTALTAAGSVITGYHFNTRELRKGSDILDVWFESGASHHAVLEGTHPDLGYPAAMYLEGSDQHRGWFQASLLEAAGYRATPPFREILTHGFIVDSHGHKMSKSQGNDIKVSEALKQNGADVLRLWVASVDYQDDMPCSRELLERTGDAYRKIRNTIRYLLGNLYDFDLAQHAAAPEPYSIDTWMLGRLAALTREVHTAYDRYEFHKVFRAVYDFCNIDISTIYAKAVKDRMYCELPDDPRRRASQSVCAKLLTYLVELCAPMLAFTADEVCRITREMPGLQHLFGDSIHTHLFTALPETPNAELLAHWEKLMPLVQDGLKQLDTLKKSVGLGNPLDSEAVLTVPADHPLAALMPHYGREIEDVLGAGFHRIIPGEKWAITMLDTREKYPSCARSWKRRPDVGSNSEYPDLSARDAAVVKALTVRAAPEGGSSVQH